ITLTSANPSASSVASQTGCPTVTATRELCTTCPVPACLGLATITQSCGCPTPIPTIFRDFPCALGCSGIWCSTSYTTVMASYCPGDGSEVTSEPATRTPQPSGTSTGSSVGTSSTPTVSVNAAGKLQVPLWLW
ncbi:hypothetical protein C8A05DRAFT_12787, partial [Staphylotrichum tortipilum]